MTIISLIAAMDERSGLGINNRLLCHLPADLQHFKSITLGKPIIMGRRTYESIGRPLPGRLNIVVSRTPQQIEGVKVIDSLDKVLSETINFEEIMIIGGAQLYTQTIPIADRLYITRIHHQFTADVFFPEIDPNIWICRDTEFRPNDEKNKFDMTFCTFEKLERQQ